MIRKTVVLLLLLGMFFIPILSAMSYPVHEVWETWVILDSDGNVCSIVSTYQGFEFHDHILSNGQSYIIENRKTASTDECN